MLTIAAASLLVGVAACGLLILLVPINNIYFYFILY